MPFDLSSFASSCHVPCPKEFMEKCRKLHSFLTEYNTRVNLTRLTSESDFNIKHVADSLGIALFFQEIYSQKLVIADIGCGAGFPSLVLAMAFPNLSICAIDSIGKKVNFVAAAAEHLELTNVKTIHGRSIELNCKSEFQGKFDIVTARAVAPSPKIFKEANKFLRRGGRFIFYKTPQQANEEKDELAAVKNMHWYNTETFSLPENAGERVFSVGYFK